jgi:peroxiredoxin
VETSIPFFLSYAALWILVILHSLVLLGLVRIMYQLQQNSVAVGMLKGQEAPKFSAVSLSKTLIHSTDPEGRLTALLFVSSTCSSCAEALTDIDYLRYKTEDGNIIVICRSGREDCVRLVEKHKLNIPVVADEDNRISNLYHISTVPMVVVINALSRIESYGQFRRDENLKEPFPLEDQGKLQAVS